MVLKGKSKDWKFLLLRIGTCDIGRELEGGSLKVFRNATRGRDVTGGDFHQMEVKSTSDKMFDFT